MRWKGLTRKAGRRAIGPPSVPTMADPGQPTTAGACGGDPHPSPPIDRTAVQYLDRVRAIYRPARGEAVAPGLARFVGREDIFRHVGMASDGMQPVMQCPPYWPEDARRVAIDDLEILEILEDQDVRAG